MEESGPAIRALGNLFKLTQVNLWDDDASDIGVSTHLHKANSREKVGSKEECSIDDFVRSAGDLEISRKMNEMGLPLSFQTSKEKKAKNTKVKKKDPKKKALYLQNDTNDEMLDLIRFPDENITAPVCINDKENLVSTLGEDGLPCPKLDSECSSGSSMVENGNGHNYVNTNIVCAYETNACSQSTEIVDENTGGSTHDNAFGDWRSYWDDHYKHTYYFNVTTQVSTWYPPHGVTDFEIPEEFNDSAELAVEIEESETVESSVVLQTSLDMVKESINGNGSCCEAYSESREIDLIAESVSDNANKKKKKKNRTRMLKLEGILHSANEDSQIRGGFEETSLSMNKYFIQRYLLFSRFDKGIQMDEEGWFSVTPERIAKHHAERCEGGVTIDCFTGVGGNAIQFAKRSQHVIAIDIDPLKIDYARHNAAIYGVEDHIDFVRGDCFLLASMMKANTVFLSPPWGGPDYSKVKTFDMNIMLQPHDGQFLFKIAKKMAPKVVMYLPRNVDVNQLAEIAMSSNPPWSLEVEKNYLNGKWKAITAYFDEPALQND